ncbi:MAG: hypothetical protein KAI64_00090 [Thermoplasmata archaeon]|nr:hypothetical protein [Thermoplasmata archaeon]
MSAFVVFLIMPLCFAAADDSAAFNTNHLTGVVWTWEESFDPYDGGTVYKPDSLSAGHTFLFMKDGTFVEDYPGGCCRYEGKWEYGDSSAKLTLRYTDERRNGDRLVYELRELSIGKLRLGIRARHGVVIETYQHSENDTGEE